MSLDLVPDRIYSQYRDKPKFVKWMDITRDIAEPINEAYDKIALSWDIDSASGELLNIVGRIVGVDRTFINRIKMAVAMCGDKSTQAGDKTKTMFSPPTVSQDSAMSDGLFKLLIKAKILKNNRSATIEDIIEQMVGLIGVDFIRVNNQEDMSFTIEFSGAITPLQRYALFNENIIQIPQGVMFNGFRELTSLVMFGNKEYMAGDISAQASNLGGI